MLHLLLLARDLHQAWGGYWVFDTLNARVVEALPATARWVVGMRLMLLWLSSYPCKVQL